MTGVKVQAGGFFCSIEKLNLTYIHTNINTLPVLLQLVVQQCSLQVRRQDTVTDVG